MIIEISSSGGFGGIASTALHKRIDVDRQSSSVQRELGEYFGPRDLNQLARDCKQRCNDGMLYQITVTDGGNRQTYTIPEQNLPPQMLDLIDQIDD